MDGVFLGIVSEQFPKLELNQSVKTFYSNKILSFYIFKMSYIYSNKKVLLSQCFSTLLMPQPFNTVPLVVVVPDRNFFVVCCYFITIILLLYIVMSIFLKVEVCQVGQGPQVENH